ncbi:XIAP-associated factor 1 isoform X1 [Tachysurus fulvidraco]|uniref:XIAP-associated factor 1 isoform X1 n=1 Tax=Tachysurus fulvidraco TaxID=1234273 RepID=UPI000F4E9EB8|nr:XIAP-associated factor 1 isoform X1 [Tachysurus fulvidraco]
MNRILSGISSHSSCGDVLRQQPLCPQPTALGGTEERDVMASEESNENRSTSKTFEIFNTKNYRSDYPDDSRAHCSKDLFANHKQCQDRKDKKIDRYIKYLARIYNVEPVNTEQISLCTEGSRKWQSNDDILKTLTIIQKQWYSPSSPYGNLMVSQTNSESSCTETLPSDRTTCREGREVEEEPVFVQQPAKQRSLKKKKKSPRENDNDDDNHETWEMIRQQIYSPRGSYGNRMVSKTNSESSCTEALLSDRTRCRDDREVEEEPAFGQQPAKQRSLKKKKKSPRENDNDDDNHETLAMIRQQMYSPSGPYGNRMLNQLEPSDLASSSFAHKGSDRD